MNEVGFSAEFNALRLRHAALRERVASQIELYTHLVEVEGPDLQVRYMMHIGQLEYRAYSLEVDVSRWKRRFALRQQFLNCGEKPDFVWIESTLMNEFSEFLGEVDKHLAEIKDASYKFHEGRLSHEETTAIRCAYLDAVKKLHPDINPDLPKSARELWNQIQKAYAAADWDYVKFLASFVDGVVAGDTTFAASSDGLAELRASCARLEGKSADIAAETERLKANAPYTYKALLTDKELVADRQNRLNAKITALEKALDEYKEAWENGK